MGFICELFRATQETGSLFDLPFDEAARAEVARGVVRGRGARQLRPGPLPDIPPARNR